MTCSLSRLIDRFILRFASGPTRRLFRRALLDAAQREWGLSLHRPGYTSDEIGVLCLVPDDGLRQLCDRRKKHRGRHSWQLEEPF